MNEIDDCRVAQKPRGLKRFRVESCWDGYRVLELCVDGEWWWGLKQPFDTFAGAEKALKDHKRYLEYSTKGG